MAVKFVLIATWAIVVFITFVAFLVYLFKPMFAKKIAPVTEKIKFFSLSQSEELIQNHSTQIQELELLVKSFVHYHKIPDKQDASKAKDAKKLLDLIFTLASHNNMSKELRMKMFDDLISHNPSYAHELNRGR